MEIYLFIYVHPVQKGTTVHSIWNMSKFYPTLSIHITTYFNTNKQPKIKEYNTDTTESAVNKANKYF
jgi:hypothetical protein